MMMVTQLYYSGQSIECNGMPGANGTVAVSCSSSGGSDVNYICKISDGEEFACKE